MIAAWRVSTASGGGNCAEVSQDGAVVLIRDTTDRGGPVLAFSGDEWTRFLARVRSG